MQNFMFIIPQIVNFEFNNVSQQSYDVDYSCALHKLIKQSIMITTCQ